MSAGTGICLRAGIPTTTDTDADGLPKWMHAPGCGYHHGDPVAMARAELFILHGFNLPKFDLWLSTLEPCGAKAELLKRRANALDSARRHNMDGVLRHLEWIMLRRDEILRDGVLLPLARTGAKVRRAGADGASQATKEAKERATDWQARADAIWARNPALSKSEVAKKVAAAGEKPDTIRRRIRKPFA